MNKQAGVWVRCSERLPVCTAKAVNKFTGEVGELTIHKKRAVFTGQFSDNIYQYEFHNKNLFENIIWLDEQPIPVNQDSCIKMRTAFCKTTIYGEDSNELYQLYKWIISKAGITAAEFYATSEEYNKMSEQLKSSPSPTPVNEDFDLEHFVDWVILNYEPRIDKKTRTVMWNLDDANALYTTEEVIEDYKEHNPPTPVQEGLREDEKK